jgi:transposase
MFEALGITEVIDQATTQDPARRMVTAGHAVKAMVLNGLGFLNPQRSLVPHFCQNQPISRLIAPGMQASHRHDETRGRALDTLSAAGLTALYRLMAATAAQRLGVTSTCRPLATTRVHGEGRSNSAAAPDAQVVPITQGDRREHRPDRNHVMVAVVVEPHAGIPVLMQPLRGHRNESQAFGQVVRAHRAQLPPTSHPM